jgi:hypothetical protein
MPSCTYAVIDVGRTGMKLNVAPNTQNVSMPRYQRSVLFVPIGLKGFAAEARQAFQAECQLYHWRVSDIAECALSRDSNVKDKVLP